MGNTTARPTNKLNLLVEEVQDFSFNLSQNISQAAEQNIVVSQEQNVTLGLGKLEGCEINITQSANIMANQTALFKAVFTNPRELIRKLAVGPDSILQQAMNSKSKVMSDFMNIAKQKFGVNDDANLQAKITNILKINIDQNSIQRCSQDIFTNQSQRVTILGSICKDSRIKIGQDLVVVAAQSCFFDVTQNALMEDPTMRVAVREFNGDYQAGYLNDQLDAGASIPPACFNTGKIVYRNPSGGETPSASLGAMTSANVDETIIEDKEKQKKQIKQLRLVNSTLLGVVIILIIFIIFFLLKK